MSRNIWNHDIRKISEELHMKRVIQVITLFKIGLDLGRQLLLLIKRSTRHSMHQYKCDACHYKKDNQHIKQTSKNVGGHLKPRQAPRMRLRALSSVSLMTFNPVASSRFRRAWRIPS